MVVVVVLCKELVRSSCFGGCDMASMMIVQIVARFEREVARGY